MKSTLPLKLRRLVSHSHSYVNVQGRSPPTPQCEYSVGTLPTLLDLLLEPGSDRRRMTLTQIKPAGGSNHDLKSLKYILLCADQFIIR